MDSDYFSTWRSPRARGIGPFVICHNTSHNDVGFSLIVSLCEFFSPSPCSLPVKKNSQRLTLPIVFDARGGTYTLGLSDLLTVSFCSPWHWQPHKGMDPQSKNLFQLIQDRNAGQTITYLALSTKQDLVAYATVKGEVGRNLPRPHATPKSGVRSTVYGRPFQVLIYNSDWMKVANYKALSFLTGENVSFLAWRPDGRGESIKFPSSFFS